jgi:hypothetical protein
MPPLLSVPEQYGDDITPNFDVFLLDENDVASATRNPYVKKSSEDSLLHILQPKRVKNAFENENKESNLFHLFVGRSLFEAILRWTNKELAKKGKRQISLEKLMAYIGLEIAMSIVEIGSIKQYWETKAFSGHGDFRDTMSRDDFQDIRAALQFHPSDVFDDDESKERDPLYHSRTILNHFIRQCVSVAVTLCQAQHE